MSVVTIKALTLKQHDECLQLLRDAESDTGEVTAWKRFQVQPRIDGSGVGFFGARKQEDLKLVGAYKSEFRYESGLNKDPCEIGFHVYVGPNKPRSSLSCPMLPVYFKMDDLLALGNCGGGYMDQNPVYAATVRQFWLDDADANRALEKAWKKWQSQQEQAREERARMLAAQKRNGRLSRDLYRRELIYQEQQEYRRAMEQFQASQDRLRRVNPALAPAPAPADNQFTIRKPELPF